MNRLLRFTLTTLIATASLISAADTIGPGNYKGAWSGAGGGGDFRISLKADGKGGFTGEVGFTINGAEVPGKFTKLEVAGAKIDMSYDFDLEGNKLTSAAQGTLKGNSIEGTYKTTAGGQDVDTGTWKVAAQ